MYEEGHHDKRYFVLYNEDVGGHEGCQSGQEAVSDKKGPAVVSLQAVGDRSREEEEKVTDLKMGEVNRDLKMGEVLYRGRTDILYKI